MPILEDRPRQVVPRWRLFEDTLGRRELAPIRSGGGPRFTEERVANQVHDWKIHQSFSVAADLVSVALALGLKDVAVDAAQFVIACPNATNLAISVAEIYLNHCGTAPSQTASRAPHEPVVDATTKLLLPSDGIQILEIHRTRSLLTENPRNPIEWCNLALLFTSLGVLDKANRAMQVALSLAPSNRFVLRSAARFFLHVGDGERAHQILATSPFVRTDPWILSAEIATADAIRKSSKLIRFGLNAIDRERFDNHHSSELISAIGTLECKAGKIRSGRQMIARSLKDPSENAIAQAAWLQRQFNLSIDLHSGDVSPEASAWMAWEKAEWSQSLSDTHRWQRDQPFSSRPAEHGSFIASTVLGNYDEAKVFAMAGLRSNPDDVSLVNNFCFAAAMKGDLDEAKGKLDRVEFAEAKVSESIAILATKGLIAFRKNRLDEGRTFYNAAIQLARRNRDEKSELQARLHLLLEESRHSQERVDAQFDEAERLAGRLTPPLGTALSEMVRQRRIDSVRYETRAKPLDT
jgi:tetratricopeptide (TPR) repeat protein